MASSNYTNFLTGVTIRNVPILQLQPGLVWWVNNSGVLPNQGIAGSDSNKGTFNQPFATIAGALSHCVASRGDIIAVMPGHAETYSTATAAAWNVAGVAIVGLGSGALRPTFTLGTGTTSTINVSANNMTLSNLIFVANFAAVASAITTTTATNLIISACDFKDSSSALNFVNVVKTDATSNHTDNLVLDSCNIYGLGTTSATLAVNMAGTNDRFTFTNNFVQNLSTSNNAYVLAIATGKIVTNLKISDNILNLTGASGNTVGAIVSTNGSTNTGTIQKNQMFLLTASPILATASSGLRFNQNFVTLTPDASGILVPTGGTA